MQKNIPLTGGYSLNLLVSEGDLNPHVRKVDTSTSS